MPGGGADSKPAFSLTTAVQSAPRTRPATNRWRPGDCASTNHELRLRVGPSLHLRLPTERESTSSSRQSPPATASFPALSPSLDQSKCSLSTPRPANQECGPARLCVCSRRHIPVASEEPVPPPSSFSSVWFEGSGGKLVCGGLPSPPGSLR